MLATYTEEVICNTRDSTQHTCRAVLERAYLRCRIGLRAEPRPHERRHERLERPSVGLEHAQQRRVGGLASLQRGEAQVKAGKESQREEVAVSIANWGPSKQTMSTTSYTKNTARGHHANAAPIQTEGATPEYNAPTAEWHVV